MSTDRKQYAAYSVHQTESRFTDYNEQGGVEVKKVLVVTAAAALLAFAPLAMAASRTCEVVSIAESEVVLNCEDVKGISVGDQVKIKTKKKSKAIEGC